MEKVNFYNNEELYQNAEQAFLKHRSLIRRLLPDADIQHIGSTAIPGSMTKGDLDIQVRVEAALFPIAVQRLSTLYKLNEGSTQTDSFRAFKDDSENPPLGVQLTVIDSEYDFFWKFRNILLMNDKYQKQYDDLKKNYEGKDMEHYREAKSEFFEKLMATPEYKQIENS